MKRIESFFQKVPSNSSKKKQRDNTEKEDERQPSNSEPKSPLIAERTSESNKNAQNTAKELSLDIFIDNFISTRVDEAA